MTQYTHSIGTLLSARCKYKMISAQQAKLNNYKNTKLKLLKTLLSARCKYKMNSIHT